MKALFDVIKVLILVNGVIVVPSFFLVMVMYEQQSKTMAKLSEVNDLSSEFHRDIQDDPLNYEQEIEANRQQLEKLKAEKDQQIQALQTQLTASRLANAVTPVVVERPLPKPSTAQVTTASQPIAKTKPAKVQSTPPNLQKTGTALLARQTQRHQIQASPQDLAVNPPKVDKVSSVLQSSQGESIPVHSEETIPVYPEQFISVVDPKEAAQKPGKTVSASSYPKKFISIDDLRKDEQQQATNSSQPTVPPQGKTPITLANDLSAGLLVADNKNQLNYGTKNYRKVQTAIRSLRKGSSDNLREAAMLAGIELSVLMQLAKWGQDRPGSFDPRFLTRRSY